MEVDVDRLLIEQIKMYSFLYDTKSEDYKCMRKKEQAWNAIAIHLDLTEKQCRKRWKALRDCYKRCKRKENLSKKNGTPLPKKLWRYYNVMGFLDGVKRSTGYFEDIDPLNSPHSFVNIEKKPLNISMSTDSTDSELQTTCSAQQNESQSTPLENESLDKRFSKFLNDASATFSDTCATYLTSKKNSTAVYFASLANKIIDAQLPPDVVNRIEAQVSNVVFTEMDKYYQEMKMYSSG